MVVQSKQLRANAAKVHSGLRWDQVELKCWGMWEVSIPTRAVFVWNLMAVKHYLCMSMYPPTQTGVSCSWGRAQGKRETEERHQHIMPHSHSVGKVHC